MLAVLSMVAPLSGCLVTQNTQFEGPPNSPPSIRSSASAIHPLNRIVPVLLDGSSSSGDASGSGPIRLSVDVYEPDIDQQLLYKVYVDYNPDAPIRVGAVSFGEVDTVPASLGLDRTKRTLDITVNRSIFARGCHRIELFVTSEFQPEGPDPVDPGDLAVATWWVAAQSTSSDAIDMAGCP